MVREQEPPGEAWTLMVVPPGGRGGVREYHVTPGQLRAIRVFVVSAAALLVFCTAALFVTVPRSVAYRGLVDENLALKLEIQQIDDRMSEVDRILLRLRLYDAELKSLAEPAGDFGPLPEDAFANSRFIAAYGDEQPMEFDDPAETGASSATDWVSSVNERTETFLAMFQMAEPDLAGLLGDLENLRALEAALPSYWPAKAAFSSGYGWRRNPFGRRHMKFHSGLDLAGPVGTPIHAAAGGKVIAAEYHAGYGRMVLIDHGYGITTLYGHCSKLLVEAGDLVSRGDLIAQMGSTGRSTGSHLHFEVHLDGHAVDPLDYLNRH